MTNNEILARWQGWECINGDWVAPSGRCENLGMTPNYLNDNSAAMSLLDTLVEKGFYYSLIFVSDKHSLEINKRDFDVVVHRIFANARREAIIAACLEVARKELEG